MIRYALACETDHRFESWFRDSDTFDEQAGKGLVECPICRSTEVTKTIMAPAIVGARTIDVAPANRSDPVAVASPPAVQDNSGDDPAKAVRALVKALRDHVLTEGTDVGERFPDEARRIHDGEAPARTIYGRASADETRELLDDGIMVFPLPISSDGLN